LLLAIVGLLYIIQESYLLYRESYFFKSYLLYRSTICIKESNFIMWPIDALAGAIAEAVRETLQSPRQSPDLQPRND
jgi:hypothetical protein